MIAWEQPFEIAFRHRAALAEESYKKLRLVWNSNCLKKHKLYIFRTTFVPTICYGLDALTLTDPNLRRIDAWYHKLLRRVIGIKATSWSRISNWSVWNLANRPQPPSTTLQTLQIKALANIVCSSPEDPMHNVVFCHPMKDRIQAQGRRKGMQFPYWVEVTTHRHFPNIWIGDHTARSYAAKQLYGQKRTVRNPQEPTQKPARPGRAGAKARVVHARMALTKKSTEMYYEEALPLLEALLEEAASMTREASLNGIQEKRSQRAFSATKRLSLTVRMQTPCTTDAE